MPNLIANLVFFSWPIIVYLIVKRQPKSIAIFISTTFGYLILPANFVIDPPLLPPIDKTSICALSLMVSLFILRIKYKLFQSGPILIILGIYLIGIVMSCFANSDPVAIGGAFLQGLAPYDAISEIIRGLLFFLPFLLGRCFLYDVKNNEKILKIFVTYALFYSILMLYEIRMSPQLHSMLYGYYPSDFIQSYRGDGFRASVFVGHGLPLAFWISTAAIAAMTLHKNKVKISKFSALSAVLYLVVVLVLSKTWVAFFNIALGAIFIYMLRPSKQVKLSLFLASLILFYPVSKITGVFPDKEIIQTISEYNVERADSMKTRYINEDQLLDHSLKRPILGWSGYGRNRLYDSFGEDITITDGMWIIQMSIYGTFGFVLYYLILLTPLYYAVKSVNYIDDPKDKLYFSFLSVLLAICIIDSIPNTSMGPMHWLLAGALIGQAESLKKQKYQQMKEKISQSWLKKTS